SYSVADGEGCGYDVYTDVRVCHPGGDPPSHYTSPPTTMDDTAPLILWLLVNKQQHATCSGEGETTELPPSFRKTVQDIVTRFETRLAVVEAGVGGLQGKRAAQLEAELQRLQDTLSFMSRRLDLTRAPAWVTGGHT
ncbi:hypothetical protein OTU49_002985, partial [Cherax quadricarinatus]